MDGINGCACIRYHLYIHWLIGCCMSFYCFIFALYLGPNQYSTEKWNTDANTIYFSAYLLTMLDNLLVWIYRQFSNHTVHNLKTEKVFTQPNTQRGPVYVYFEYKYCQFGKLRWLDYVSSNGFWAPVVT